MNSHSYPYGNPVGIPIPTATLKFSLTECNEAAVLQQAAFYPLFRSDLAPDQQLTLYRAAAQKEALTHFVGV